MSYTYLYSFPHQDLYTRYCLYLECSPHPNHHKSFTWWHFLIISVQFKCYSQGGLLSIQPSTTTLVILSTTIKPVLSRAFFMPS